MLYSMAGIYDVIVIGAGPAGTTLAYILATSGAKVLVIEKETLPRYKCCGGGLTAKTLHLLETFKVDISDVIENSISNVTIQFGEKTRDFSENFPLMYTVSRDRFDHHLVKQAKSTGAEVMQETKALEIANKNGCVEVLTDKGTFRSQFLAGADGANGITSLYINSRHQHGNIVGIESEIEVPDSILQAWRSRVLLEFGHIKAGYAWVFPKIDHLSVGIGCMERYTKNIKSVYKDFIESLNLNRYTVTKLKGSVIPIYGKKNIYNSNRVLLLGDAAGLADPLTGEGIYNAIRSAGLAGTVIRESLRSDSNLDNYTRLITERILPDIRIAATFSKILALVPQQLYTLLENDERVWRSCKRLLCGEIQYTDIMSGLKNLGGMYNFVMRR